jgi:hypothetical protein
MRKNAAIVVFLLLVAQLPLDAAENTPAAEGLVVSRVTAVYGANAFNCQIDGLGAGFGRAMPVIARSVELHQVEEPNAQEKLTLKAKKFTEELLRQAKVVSLANISRDRYFRIIADVHVDGRNLANLLAEAGLAEAPREPQKPRPTAPTKQDSPADKQPKFVSSRLFRSASGPSAGSPAGTGQAIKAPAARNLLEEPMDFSALSPDMSLGEAVEIIRNLTEPALNIIVLWRDLSANALIEADTPIGFQAPGRVPLGLGIELLLAAVSQSGAELAYIIDRDVIVIATRQYLGTRMITRSYDITDIMQRQGDFFIPPFVGLYGGYGSGGSGGYGTGRTGSSSSRRGSGTGL